MPSTSSNTQVCTICNRTGFNSTLAFMDHQNLHSQTKPYKCECGFDSNLLANLILHLKKEGCPLDSTTWPPYAQVYRKTREQKLRSFEGKKVAPKRVRFANDLPLPKRMKMDSDKMYCCWECDFRSPSTAKVYNHYEERHMEKTIQCSDCSKMFPSQSKVILHKRRAHADLEKCDLCELMIPRKRMQKHLDVKHKKPFMCDDCGALFAYEKSLLTHQERLHKKTLFEPLVVPCLLCENEIDINNESLESHLASRFHWIYEASWKEYNDIDSIPCYDCEDWETTDFETALHHFSVEHKKGTKNALEFLAILGKQDPDLINAVGEKTRACLSFTNNVKECQEVEEEKVLLATKFTKSITCFMCFRMIHLGESTSLDRAVMRHVEKKMHLKEVEEWKKTRGVTSYPCQDCKIKTLTSLQMAFVHSKQAHEYSYFEYFEFLRSQIVPAPDSKRKTKCFICCERVSDMKNHLRTSVGHKCAERQWMKSWKIHDFPCSFCLTKFPTTMEASQHAYKEHKQPSLEYMHYLEISTKSIYIVGTHSSSIFQKHDGIESVEIPV